MGYSVSARVLLALLIGLLIAVLLPVQFGLIYLFAPVLLPFIVLPAPLRWVSVVMIGLLVGLIWQAWALSLRPPVDRQQPVIMTGQVVGLPERAGNRQRFLFAPDELHNVDWATPRRIRLSLYADTPRLSAGERWQLAARLRRPRGFMNPVRFDYEDWLASEHIDATGYVVDGTKANRLAAASGIHAWRERVSRRIAALTGELGQGSAILQGLVTGDRRAFNDATWTLLRATGTSHLVAISGLHIGLVAALGFWLGKRLWRMLWLGNGQRACGVMTGLLAALGYAALSGFALPAQRALVMLAIVAMAKLLCAHAPITRVLLIAAFIVLLFDPAAALGAGFWLSFCAVALIGWVARGQTLNGLQGLCRLQVVLVLGLAPVSALFFGQWSPLGLGVNLFAVPLFSLVVVPGALIASALAMVAPSVGQIGLMGLGHGIEGLLSLGKPLLDLGLGSVAVNATDALTLALALAGVGLLILPAGTPLKGLSVVLLLPLLVGSPSTLPYGSARITWLEVGQGNAAVIETQTQVHVVDTGPGWRSGHSAASYTLIPFLQDKGIDPINRLTVTHADNDHRGGLSALRGAMPIARIDAGEPLSNAPNAHRCEQGQRWSANGVEFAYLWPPPDYPDSGNNASCVLLVSTPGARVLLTGDIEAGVEQRIAQQLTQPVDVLEAPHHGSATSSTQALLKAAQPQMAVVSAGYRNPYGMPHPAVLERMRCGGIDVYDLGRVGALSLRLDSSGIVHTRAERIATARILNERETLGRFQDGQEIHYDQRRYHHAPTEANQTSCGN